MAAPITPQRPAQLHLFAPPKPAPAARPAAPPTLPEEQLRLWAAPEWTHMTQFRSEATPDAPDDPLNADCGPTSALMAVRLLGLDIPGFHGEHTEAAIARAREIATGRNAHRDGTDPRQWAKVIEAAGAKATFTTGFERVLQAARKGLPVVVGGDPTARGWIDYPYTDYTDIGTVDHAIVVAGYDRAHRDYLVNDPGELYTVHVTRDQLHSFMYGRGATPYFESVIASRS